MSLKDAPQKILFLGAIEKMASLSAFYTKRQSGGETSGSPNQYRSESQCSCIFQELMNKSKYAFVGSWVKYALGKISCDFKIPPLQKLEIQRFTVFVFLSTLRLTALLLESFRPRLHCYTLGTLTGCGTQGSLLKDHCVTVGGISRCGCSKCY